MYSPSTTPVYVVRAGAGFVQETAVAEYMPDSERDALLAHLQYGARRLSRHIADLPHRTKPLSGMDESRLVLTLEALLAMHREIYK